MSELRKNLDAAKREYYAAQYPGDLSADLVKQQRPPLPLAWILIPAGIAAALLIGVWLFRVVRETDRIASNELAVAPVVDPPLLSIPAIGEFEIASPSGWSFSTPSFSLLENEVPEEDTSTTKESV